MADQTLMFASYHAYLDNSSGAALASRDLLADLAAHGWDCRAVCGPQLDYSDGRSAQAALAEQGVGHYLESCAPPNGRRYDLLHYTLDGVPVTQYVPENYVPGNPPTQDVGVPFLDVVGRAVEKFRPAVVLTYGGHPVGPHLIRRAKKRGAKVVFALFNFAYTGADFLREPDALVTLSDYAREVYRREAGVEAASFTWPWDRARSTAPSVERRFVTFVNPQPVKGVAWFARIALEVGRIRPDIQFLVVEGRGQSDWLGRLTEIDLSGLRNLHRMPNTPRPAEFYALSRMVLMPSLWEETFGRVAAEALTNGIPVLATRRGALPETLGGAGLLFDVPEPYTTQLLDVPTAEEVAPWVETVIRLWDDDAYHGEVGRRGLERAKAWEPAVLRGSVEEFLRACSA